MSLTTVIILNTVLGSAVIAALAYLLLIPFRTGRQPGIAAIAELTPEQHRRRAA